jgi:hypothetical protein
MQRWTLAVMAALLVTAHVLAGKPPLRVEAKPRLSTSPLRALHVRLWIEPDDHNRAFDVSVDGENFFRGSAEPLAGAAAPTVHDVWWDPTFVPCGLYAITAVVYDSAGKVRHQAQDRAYICQTPDDGGGQ